MEGPGGSPTHPVAPGLMALDPELTWTIAIRKGLDLYFMQLGVPVLQSFPATGSNGGSAPVRRGTPRRSSKARKARQR